MNFLHPVLTASETSTLEEKLFKGDEGLTYSAIVSAGEACAKNFAQEFSHILKKVSKPNLLGVIGSGHNGADALVMLAYLKQKVFLDAQIYLCIANEKSLKPLTRRALIALQNLDKNLHINSDLKKFSAVNFDVIIDGLLGFNFVPPFRKNYSEILLGANALSAKVKISIDVPSGIASGIVPEENAFIADVTYATGAAKKALFEPQNAECVGLVRYLDLGFFEANSFCDKNEFVMKNSALDFLNALRNPISDKRSYGHLFIFGGSKIYSGALLLNVKAALKTGVGLVSVFAPESLTPSFAAAEPSAIWIPCPEDEFGALSLETFGVYKKFMGAETCVLAGSGMTKSAEANALIAEVLSNSKANLVLDADAISPNIFEKISGRKNALITPHAGEFLRLASKADDAHLLKISKQVATLLKGHISNVSDGERIARITSGSAILSRGGSGDILAGLAGGLFARKDLSLSAFDSACLASYWLGLAAEAAAKKCGVTAVSTKEIADEFLREALCG